MTPTDPTPDRMLTREDATAPRGSTVERLAGWVFALLIGGATIGAIVSAIAWAVSLVWGWVA